MKIDGFGSSKQKVISLLKKNIYLKSGNLKLKE